MCSTTDKSSHDGGAARNDPLRYECHKQFGMQLVLVCVCVLSQTEAHTMEVLLLEPTHALVYHSSTLTSTQYVCAIADGSAHDGGAAAGTDPVRYQGRAPRRTYHDAAQASVCVRACVCVRVCVCRCVRLRACVCKYLLHVNNHLLRM